MGGHAPLHRQGHWHEDPSLRLYLVALGIVLAVFLIAFMVMTESVAALV